MIDNRAGVDIHMNARVSNPNSQENVPVDLVSWRFRFNNLPVGSKSPVIFPGFSLSVEGRRTDTGNFWSSAEIVERLDVQHVRTRTTTYRLIGKMHDPSSTKPFDSQLVEQFASGIPENWQQLLSSFLKDYPASKVKTQSTRTTPRKTSSKDLNMDVHENNDQQDSTGSSDATYNSEQSDRERNQKIAKRKRSGESESNSDTYDVERILNISEQHGKRYLIKWKNYTYQDSTWERYENMECGKSISDFRYRLCVVKKIRLICKPEELVKYPYGDKRKARIDRLLYLANWEDQLNLECEKAGVAPIFVENWTVDSKEPPKDFKFIQQNVIGKEAFEVFDYMPMQRPNTCDCEGNCGPKSNCCNTLFNEQYGYKDRRLDNDRGTVVECTDQCGCSLSCPNRIVQRGRQIPIVLFRTVDRGWSIRAATYIRRGNFVMQYCGEVTTLPLANARKDQSFQYNMDTNTDKPKFVIDALNFGNEARWVNHSCDPNLRTYGVMASRYDSAYEELAFFAIKDIAVGEELTVNYYVHLGKKEVIVGGEKCLCGSSKCRKTLM
ncbi:hypothetical protein M3Y94_00253500 [Aphelenchoides besseyi]|nr:hypothetical protein M3Y94_00253500 [Aphelenchoides besseyi]KAI6236232.1 Histone-lysine N-methyltransferase SUV39H1 isoform X2 [Aphelenchoides besseyi]